MILRKYTLEQLKDAVKDSFSNAQTLIKLNVVPAGGNYQTLNKAIRHFGIDASHFTGQLWSKGTTIGPKRDIEDYLSNKQTIQSYKLKKRLIQEGLFNHECDSCKNAEWLGKPISLELHHLDGNHENNNLDNLQLLCPNCHSFTDNYRNNKR